MKIWQPLGMLFGISRDYFENDFAEEMADRVAAIPEESLVTPALNVAGPTVQGIAFTVDEPDLRAMYLNLLATASDSRVSSGAHPSFAEIIRQLTSAEARALATLLTDVNYPIVEVRLQGPSSPDAPGATGYNVLATHVLNWTSSGQQVQDPQGALQVVNWVRLGLVTVDYATSITDPGAYEWTETHPVVVAMRGRYDKTDAPRVTVVRGVLSVTPFGREFARVVMGSELGETSPPPAA